MKNEKLKKEIITISLATLGFILLMASIPSYPFLVAYCFTVLLFTFYCVKFEMTLIDYFEEKEKAEPQKKTNKITINVKSFDSDNQTITDKQLEEIEKWNEEINKQLELIGKRKLTISQFQELFCKKKELDRDFDKFVDKFWSECSQGINKDLDVF